MIESRIRVHGRISRTVSPLAFLAALTIAFTPDVLASRPPAQGRSACGVGIRWVEVEPGTVTMDAASTARPVAVDRFLMSATEVTFDQYDAFCDA